MSTQFASDLRLARRKAGYTQDDIAHFLNSHQSVVSGLERGGDRPTLEQIVLLSLLYGRSFESLFDEVMVESRTHLTTRLASIPPPVRMSVATFNRKGSMRRLQRRLAQQALKDGGA